MKFESRARSWGQPFAVAVFIVSTMLSGGAAAQSALPPMIRDSIAGTLVDFEMVLVPGGTVTLDSPNGPRTVTVKPFYIGRTEVTWNMYDVYMLRLDSARSTAIADAIARPSMPYAVPDYDWGHDGYAAISIALQAAQSFAKWLSLKTGHTYRLPTEAEWAHAASLAAAGNESYAAFIDAVAWHRGNAKGTTHPVAARKADVLGLFDLFGNAAEWVVTDDSSMVTRGGSFRDEAAKLGPQARAVKHPTWTERDPQLPSSIWWLSDAPFVGFRIVREAPLTR